MPSRRLKAVFVIVIRDCACEEIQLTLFVIGHRTDVDDWTSRAQNVVVQAVPARTWGSADVFK